MSRIASWGVVSAFLLAIGCQSPERAAIKPIPPDAPPLNYEELLTRARSQEGAAQEFFFRDSWTDVEQAADALQETASYLAKLKTDSIPAKHRAELTKHTKEIDQIARDLHAAAAAKDVAKTNDAMQRLNLKVRELRVE